MGISLKTSPQDLIQGAGFKNLMNGFHDILNGKEKEGCNKLSMTMTELFGSDNRFEFRVVDTSGEYKFFGFRAYPKWLLEKEAVMGTTLPLTNAKGENQWAASTEWIIEIDNKINRNYSSRLMPADLTYLFIFFIEYNLCNPSLFDRCVMLYQKVFCEDRVDYRIMRLIDKEPTCRIKNMIVLQRCNWVNFLTELPGGSLLRINPQVAENYKDAIGKLITTYGTSQLINRKIDEFDREIVGIIEWIYDGVNDLRYSAFRFRKNLMFKISSMNSATVKQALINVYRAFNDSINMVFAQESAALPKIKKTKEQIAIENKNIDDFWKKKWESVIESSAYEYIDSRGFAMKADKQEIDELRVRVQSIDSVNDKIFLLERLHKQYGIIDNALSMLGDKKLSHKVKQTKTELLSYKAQLDLIREMIFKAPAGKMRFGLYVQYPQGYEG